MDCSDIIKPIGISEAVSPDTVVVGEPIISKLSGYLPSISGQKGISGITISEMSDNHYQIQVNALFEQCIFISVPAIWEYDTSISIPTTRKGTFILQFYGSDISQYDTVHVVD